VCFLRGPRHMVDRAGDSKFSISEKEKLKRFVALILARRVAARRAQEARGPAPYTGPVNPSDMDSFGVEEGATDHARSPGRRVPPSGVRAGSTSTSNGDGDGGYDSDSDDTSRGGRQRRG
jgi:hypothetical protein